MHIFISKKGDMVEVLSQTNKHIENSNKQKSSDWKRMVEVLGPTHHKRENFPPEIDVYKVPHSRFKFTIAAFHEKNS